MGISVRRPHANRPSLLNLDIREPPGVRPLLHPPASGHDARHIGSFKKRAQLVAQLRGFEQIGGI